METNTQGEEVDVIDYEIQYKKLKHKFEELQRIKSGKYIVLTGVMVFLIVLFALSKLYIDENGIHLYNLYKIAFLGITMGIISSLIRYFYFKSNDDELQDLIIAFESAYIQKEVQENIYENSIKMSYKYLDQYYAQTKDQAQKGFFITVCVSVFGAILIGIGIVSMFMDNANPSYVTCASGVITEFIASIFFYMYNKTVSSMSKYHNKLVLSHNISIALKVADTLPSEDKIKNKNLIISELLKDMNNHLIKSDSEDTEK